MPRSWRAFAATCAAVLSVAVAGGALAQDVSGRATAIQSDQITIAGQCISLFGIDGPDPDQDNYCAIGRTLCGCATNAKRALEILIADGPVTCVDSGQRNFVNFAYMTCKVGNADLGEELVKQGWALAFRKQSDRYVPPEAEAKAAKRSVWQDAMRFVAPWEWREMDNRPIFGP